MAFTLHVAATRLQHIRITLQCVARQCLTYSN